MSWAERTRGYVVESVRELWDRPAHQVPALDGIRALAVTLVVLGHFFDQFWPRYMAGTPQPGFAELPLFNWGWTGVDLFFVLSGFLIGQQLCKEKQRTGSIRFWPFFLRRGFRIWPLYFVMMLWFLWGGAVRPNWHDFLLVSNYLPAGFSRGWSLSTEEQFYILVPLALIVAPRWKSARPAVAAIVVALVGVWTARYLTFQHFAAAGMESADIANRIHNPFHLHNEALLGGFLLSVLSVYAPEAFKSGRRNGFSAPGFAIFALTSAAAFALRVAHQKVFAFTALALIYTSLALWLMWDGGIAGKVAGWRAFFPVSRLSYGMYLNHYFVLPGVTLAVIQLTLGATGSVPVAAVAGIVAGFAVSMVVAAETFMRVERPSLILRDRVLRRDVHMHAAVSSAEATYPQPSTAHTVTAR